MMSDLTLTALHVGGRGGMGEVERLFCLKSGLNLSVFEANIEQSDTTWDSYDALISEYATKFGIKLSVLPYCLANAPGKKAFHINAMPDCSSLLEPNPDLEHYQRMNNPFYRIVWGQICRPQRSVLLDVTSIDRLLTDKKIAMPHFISIDAQGAEYQILEGANDALRGDLVGVISEVEFRPLYSGQRLFFDQHALLARHGLHFVDLYNTEHWFPGPILGKGFLTVGEALFLRDYRFFVQRDIHRPDVCLAHLSRLAMVALCFERASYAYEIMDFIMTRHAGEWATFKDSAPGGLPVALEDFYKKTSAAKAYLDRVPTHEEFLRRHPNSGGETAGGRWDRRIRRILPAPLRRFLRRALGALKRTINLAEYVLR